MRRTLLTLTVMVVLTVACGGRTGYTVLAPDARVDGMTTAQIAERWIKALLEAPVDESWLVDISRCDNGLSTNAIYFAPTFATPGDTSVSCTMKAGQVAFLNPVGVFCTETDGDIADTACIDREWILTSASVSIDGVELPDLAARQYETPAFAVTLPDDNIMEAPPGPSKAIARGQAFLVRGLDRGTHEVVLAGNFNNGEFAGSLTINLTVE
jgi:hypothetical protein